MTIGFGGETGILQPGATWTAEVTPGERNVYASSNVPEPISFSGKVYLVTGYEYTWVLVRSE